MEAQTPNEQRGPGSRPELNFGNGSAVGVVGVLSGAAIAVGGPWVLLAHASALDQGVVTHLVVACLIVGGLISLTAAFFGLVMPRHIHGPWMDPGHWERLARRKQEWRERRWRMMQGLPLERMGADDEDGAEAPARAPRRGRGRRP